MANAWQCDNCGRLQSEVHVSTGWRRSAYISGAAFVGVETGTKLFCSWACEGEYATVRAEENQDITGQSRSKGGE